MPNAAHPCGGRRGPLYARRCVGFILGVLGLVVAAARVEAAPKTDVVVFENGDRLTGEIKGLERGQLQLKTDATDTISIKWEHVATVQTNQFLQVELADGERYAGRAPQAGATGTLRIAADEGSQAVELPLANVVRIAPIEQGRLLERLDGYLTAGYNNTKANNLQQFTFTGGLSSRTEQRQWSLDGSSTATAQQGKNDSSRYDVSGSYRRFFPERWFLQGSGGFESNNELGLDLRTTIGAAFGRYLVQTNRQEWGAYVGLQVTREAYSGVATTENIEGVLGTQYYFFRFDHPKASFDATLEAFPSLTQSGRVRAEGKLRSRYEIVKDLFFEVSLYGSYDSDPGDTSAANSDYGLTTSLGYSF